MSRNIAFLHIAADRILQAVVFKVNNADFT